MGVEYKGAIVVGYTYDEALQIAEGLGLEAVGDLAFDMYSPSYDGDEDESIFGQRIEKTWAYMYNEIDLEDLDNTAKVLSDEWEGNFGVRPKVYLMAQGY